MNFVIQPFDPAQHLEAGFRETLGALSPTTADADRIDLASFRRQKACHVTFVCLDGERVVGTFSVLFEAKLSRECRDVAHLEDVAVHPDYQARGVGRFMLEWALKYVREKGVRSFILDCDESVAGFYERLGFVRNGVCLRVLFNG